ncbi:hypothetical protein A3A64_01260 [Candidatus Gottesmanbacteria bacterium RIFCSPLOWO2_01_FULL_48_11]|uniref:beta-glucosidase n=3 Tax=Candidatus Gottesmaniibacteriota TaxID=1752720 RepID=A0A0G1UQB6_9BACT|nr:MAG: Beta-glucosidase [Candidatus Gottesmanbacteria bacterium GW2011_GWA2_47_9]KKU96344.1 MAG: Beta-glucosidase [Candidatus Gottesmanbacteria bacterium GW2011_GWA1_48_13]OGG28090.1 MAG: hypothetical protein A3A64_01260 [Candidatus Gottesmanbacteria bacterium RIFCSPLOWO2_01_FULL_48_11]
MNSIVFPSDFRFGVADADLQVIGEDNTIREEGSEKTMWYNFAQHSGKVHDHATPGIGIDRYHRWRQDIEIMKAMGAKHYRTSVSMSRTLFRNGQVNAKAIAWYTNYFKALKRAGIAIYVTLYHWELPLYLHEQGGWTNKKTTDVFVKHARTVAQNLGEYIEEYFILNEPWCSAMLSYHLGIHAPGETNLTHALLAAHNLLLAQGAAYTTLRSVNKSIKISTVVNTQPSYAASTTKEDREAAQYADEYFNRWFTDPLYIGKYPEHLAALYGRHMPKYTQADMKQIQVGPSLYTLGVNYYRGDVVAYNPKIDRRYASVVNPKGPTNDLGWPIYIPPYYSEGLYDMLQQLYYSYKDHGLKRMYITENGMALRSDWDGKRDLVHDDRRTQYYHEHIRQIHKAIRRGIPVEGYFAWSLMDNYEWAEGYRPESCFGMIYVDRKTMKRVWKTSAWWYKQVIATHKIP